MKNNIVLNNVKNSNVTRIIVFLLFPFLFFLFSLFDMKNKVTKFLFFISLLLVIIFYTPNDLSDFWRVKEFYEKTKYLPLKDVLKLRVDFFIPFIMYLCNILSLPFRFFLIYIYIYIYIMGLL